MNEKIDKLMTATVKENRFRLRMVVEGLLVGLGCGLAVGLFRYLLGLSEEWRPLVYDVVAAAWGAGGTELLLPVAYVLAFIIIAWLLARIVANEPMCTGSGIPQIKGILLGKMYMRWYSVLVSKIIGGVLAIGAGMSLGREGPSVQIGACVGQGISRNAKRTRMEERMLLTAGSGAGLAAAFNAPLAGVIFSLEELQKSFSPLGLLAAITAAVTAVATTELFFGTQPVFDMGYLLPFPLQLFWVLILTGVFIGLLGRCFNGSLLFAMNTYDRLGLKGMRRALLPLVMAAVLGFALPEILGGGNELVDSLVREEYAIGFLCLLFVGKFLFTMVCFGSGVPGGIFLPMLVLGAAGGAFLAKVLATMGILPEMYMADMVVFGMAAYFAAVVKSPVTAGILIMEMTGSFQHMLALITVSLTAYLVADLTGGEPVYDQLLDRSLQKRPGAARIQAGRWGRQVALELVVHQGSPAAGKRIGDIPWPEKMVLLDVRRGMYRLVPDKERTLQVGDYLYLLTEDTDIDVLQKLVEKEMPPDH